MPRLDDPKEFAIVRSMYFKDRDTPEEVDQLERLDRAYARGRNKQNKR